MVVPTINVLALFAGAGGLELGIERAIPSARLVCCVEREAYGCATLAARMGAGDLDAAPIWSDVGTFDGKPWRGVVDLVSGGFPCQDVSVAGRGAGLDGERSGLWFEMERIIGDVRPRYVVVENVAVLTIRGLDRVCAGLAALGFNAEWSTFRASDVGAPHRRERVFVFAWRVSDAERDTIRELTEQPERRPLPAEQWDAELGYLGEGVEHAECTRWAATGGGHEEHAGAELEPGGGTIWPPGPDDAEGWRAYIEAGGPQPGICRGADGLANRLDRLRLTGNGVVPQQAAAALAGLMERASNG